MLMRLLIRALTAHRRMAQQHILAVAAHPVSPKHNITAEKIATAKEHGMQQNSQIASPTPQAIVHKHKIPIAIASPIAPRHAAKEHKTQQNAPIASPITIASTTAQATPPRHVPQIATHVPQIATHVMQIANPIAIASPIAQSTPIASPIAPRHAANEQIAVAMEHGIQQSITQVANPVI